MTTPSKYLPVSITGLFLSLLFTAGADAQTIEEGLDNPSNVGPFTNVSVLDAGDEPLPSGLWQYHNTTTHDTVDSIQSTLPKGSTSRLDALIEGPAVISFWWKIDAEKDFASLRFFSANDTASILPNPEDPESLIWKQRTFEVDCGSQPVIWFFERLSNASAVVDGHAWIDELVVTPIPDVPALRAAMDLDDLDLEGEIYTIYSTDMLSASWTSAPFVEAENGNVAKSGTIDPGEKSTMMLEIEGPAVVSFDWGLTVDPEGSSELVFKVDNSEYAYLLANSASPDELTPRTFDLGPGTHSLKFVYTQGYIDPASEYEGPNEGFVDNLVIASFGESSTLANAVDRSNGVYSNSWTRQTVVQQDGSDAASVVAPEELKLQNLYVELPDEPGLLAFWSKTETDPYAVSELGQTGGILRAYVDGDKVMERSGFTPWEKTEVNLPAGADRVFIAQFYRLGDLNTNSPNTRVFLDSITFTPGATNYQPDLSIKTKKKSLKGVGVHNASGVGQIATFKAKPRRPLGQYVVRAQNGSATDSDEILFRGTGNDRHFEFLFIVTDEGKKYNFTAAFLTGEFSTLQLKAKGLEEHEIWVIRKRKSSKRRHTVTVRGTSSKDPSKIDVVKTKLTIKKLRRR